MSGSRLGWIAWWISVACAGCLEEPGAGQIEEEGLGGEVGLTCPPTLCFGSHELCADGRCECAAGYEACGSGCVDLVGDPNNCGACGRACGPALACFAGTCSLWPPVSAQGVSASWTVSSQPGAAESHPSVSLSTGMLYQADVGGGGSQTTTGTTSGASWTAPMSVPAAPGSQTEGDVWTASSGYSGDEYIAARTLTTDQTKGGPAIAVTIAPHLANGAFDQVAQYALPLNEADDGLSIAFDEGGSSLWLAASGQAATEGLPPPRPYVYQFPNCAFGSPSGLGCLRAALGGAHSYLDVLTDPNALLDGHVTVVVNPCTHHALVSFIEQNATGHQVDVEAVSPTGSFASVFAQSIWLQPDQVCTTAAGTFNCAATNVGVGNNRWICPSKSSSSSDCTTNRYVPRVQLATKVVHTNGGVQCLLYAGWDQSYHQYFLSPATRLMASMAIVDVSDEAHPVVLSTMYSSPSHTETYGSTPAASRYTTSSAWFFAAGDNDNEHVSLQAYVASNPTYAGSHLVQVSSWMANHWMGDNLSELISGMPGGGFLATWASGAGGVKGAVVTP